MLSGFSLVIHVVTGSIYVYVFLTSKPVKLVVTDMIYHKVD